MRRPQSHGNARTDVQEVPWPPTTMGRAAGRLRTQTAPAPAAADEASLFAERDSHAAHLHPELGRQFTRRGDRSHSSIGCHRPLRRSLRVRWVNLSRTSTRRLRSAHRISGASAVCHPGTHSPSGRRAYPFCGNPSHLQGDRSAASADDRPWARRELRGIGSLQSAVPAALIGAQRCSGVLHVSRKR